MLYCVNKDNCRGTGKVFLELYVEVVQFAGY